MGHAITLQHVQQMMRMVNQQQYQSSVGGLASTASSGIDLTAKSLPDPRQSVIDALDAYLRREIGVYGLRQVRAFLLPTSVAWIVRLCGVQCRPFMSSDADVVGVVVAPMAERSGEMADMGVIAIPETILAELRALNTAYELAGEKID